MTINRIPYIRRELLLQRVKKLVKPAGTMNFIRKRKYNIFPFISRCSLLIVNIILMQNALFMNIE